MSRPTMERAIEAIEAGDLEEAKRLCEAMKWESQFMHDLLVDGVAGLISFVKEKLGDDGVEEAWEYSLERSWNKPVETIDKTRSQGRRRIARRDLARALDLGRRAEAGRLRDRRGRREADLHDEPVRLGPAAVAKSPLRPRRLGRDRRGSRLELRARGLPALLHALRVHERDAPDPLDRPPGLSRRIRPRTSTTIPAPGTGTRTRPTSPSAISSATGSSGAVTEARSRRGSPSCSASTPGALAAERDRGRRVARGVAGRVGGDALGAAPRPAGR